MKSNRFDPKHVIINTCKRYIKLLHNVFSLNILCLFCTMTFLIHLVIGYGCHSNLCDFSSATSSMGNITFNNCFAGCYKNGDRSAYGLTFEVKSSTKNMCYCNVKEGQTFYSKVGYAYYKFS